MVGTGRGATTRSSRTLRRDTQKSPERRPTRSQDRTAPPRSPGRPRRDTTKVEQRETTPKKQAVKSTNKAQRKKSPGRVSPGRKPASPKRETRAQVKKVAPPTTIYLDDSESESQSESESESGSSSMQTRSRRTYSKESSVEIMNNLRSRIAREVERPLLDRVVPLPSNNVVEKKIAEYSADEEDGHVKVISKPPKKQTLINVVLVVIFALFELALLFSIPLLCNEHECSYRLLTRKDFDAIPESVNLSVTLSYTAFILLNAILSIVPIGGPTHRSMVPFDEFTYRMNAMLALVLQIVAVITLEIYNVPATGYILNNFLSFTIASVIFSLSFSWVWLLIGAYCSKDDGCKTTSHLYNFIMGGQINPRIGPIDIKFVSVRCCIISTLLMMFSMMYQSTEVIAMPPMDANSTATWTLNLVQSIRIRPTLFVMCTLVFVYWADQFVFEKTVLSMKEFKETPWGFLKMNEYLAGSFFYAMLPKYVYDYNIELENWELALCTVLFLIGYTIYRGSNSQKHAFRENPYGPLVAKYESIPTTTGRKILCSGYWGFVRHPNYLGDIILSLAYARFVWPSPALIVIIFMVCNLAVRAVEDGHRCRQRYGLAWERYCQRVPYYLIPKVF